MIGLWRFSVIQVHRSPGLVFGVSTFPLSPERPLMVMSKGTTVSSVWDWEFCWWSLWWGVFPSNGARMVATGLKNPFEWEAKHLRDTKNQSGSLGSIFKYRLQDTPALCLLFCQPRVAATVATYSSSCSLSSSSSLCDWLRMGARPSVLVL